MIVCELFKRTRQAKRTNGTTRKEYLQRLPFLAAAELVSLLGPSGNDVACSVIRLLYPDPPGPLTGVRVGAHRYPLPRDSRGRLHGREPN